MERHNSDRYPSSGQIHRSDIAHGLLVFGPALIATWAIYAVNSGGGVNSPFFGLFYSVWFKLFLAGSIGTGFLIAVSNRWNRPLLWTAIFGLVTLGIVFATDFLVRATTLLSDPTTPTMAFYYAVGGVAVLYVTDAVLTAALWFARSRKKLTKQGAA